MQPQKEEILQKQEILHTNNMSIYSINVDT